jgi:hypothetical protein
MQFAVGLPVEYWPYDITGCEKQQCIKCQKDTWAYPEYLKNGIPLFCKSCVLEKVSDLGTLPPRQ